MEQLIEKNKVVKQIIADLKSSEEKVVLKTLVKIKDKGRTSVIIPMFDLFESTSNEKYRAEIKNIFSTIKDSYALDLFIEKLSTGSHELNEVLLFSLWSSNLNAVDFIPEVIESAIKGNYMVALEALTVVENLDGPFSNEKLEEARYLINEYFAEGPDEKTDLVKSILDVILGLEDSAI